MLWFFFLFVRFASLTSCCDFWYISLKENGNVIFILGFFFLMYNIVLSVLDFSHGHSFFLKNLSWAFEPRSVPTGALLGFRARTGSRLAPDSVIFIYFFFLRIKWLARGRLVNVSVIPGRGEIARRRTDQLKRADGLAVLNGVAARHDVERDYLGTEQAGFWVKSSGVRMIFESGVAPLDSYLEKTASEFCRDVFMPEPRIMGITVFLKTILLILL